MNRENQPFRRRTVLKTISASAIASGVLVGTASASDRIEVPGDEDTIDDAIAAAGEDDTIVVAAGDRELGVNIDVDGLTIQGPNVGIHGDSDDRGEEAVIAFQTRVDVNAENVVFDGLQMIRDFGASNALFRPEASSAGPAPGFELRNNVFADEDGGSTPTGQIVRGYPEDFVATRNLFDEVGSGWLIDAGAGNDNFEFTDNIVNGLGSTGLQVEDSTGVDITGNVFDGAREDAIRLVANEEEELDDVTVSYNDIRNTGQDPDPEFLSGIVLNALDGSFGDVEVTLNNIEDNDPFGVVTLGDEEKELTATCNFWGHPTGPENEDNPKNNPQGEAISEGVEGVASGADVEFIEWNTRQINQGENPENSCVGGKEDGNGRGQ